jgi:hypothetical protein
MDYANHASATFDRCYMLVTRRDEQPQTETLTQYLIDATEHHTFGLCVVPSGECWIDPANGGHEHEVHPCYMLEWNDIARQFLDDDWLVKKLAEPKKESRCRRMCGNLVALAGAAAVFINPCNRYQHLYERVEAIPLLHFLPLQASARPFPIS